MPYSGFKFEVSVGFLTLLLYDSENLILDKVQKTTTVLFRSASVMTLQNRTVLSVVWKSKQKESSLVWCLWFSCSIGTDLEFQPGRLWPDEPCWGCDSLLGQCSLGKEQTAKPKIEIFWRGRNLYEVTSIISFQKCYI